MKCKGEDFVDKTIRLLTDDLLDCECYLATSCLPANRCMAVRPVVDVRKIHD